MTFFKVSKVALCCLATVSFLQWISFVALVSCLVDVIGSSFMENDSKHCYESDRDGKRNNIWC